MTYMGCGNHGHCDLFPRLTRDRDVPTNSTSQNEIGSRDWKSGCGLRCRELKNVVMALLDCVNHIVRKQARVGRSWEHDTLSLPVVE